MIRGMYIGDENDSKKAMMCVIWLALGLIYLTNTTLYGQTIKEKDSKEEWTDRINRIGDEWNIKKVEIEKKYYKLVEDGKISEEQAFKKMEKEADAWMKKRIKEERKEYEKERPTMPYKYFYGKVVDQNGDAVEGADVDYGVFDIRKHTITDKNGLFKINEKGIRSLDILLRGKEGYDAKSTLPKVYYYEKDGSYKFENELLRAPDPNTPEIFKIRKKGEPTMLLTSGGRSIMKFTKEGSQAYIINFLSGAGFNCKPMNESLDRTDLIVTSEQKNGDLVIKAKAMGDNSAGLVLGRERLFMSPEDGYMIECILPITERHGEYDPLYLYCRTGTPPVYSILNLETYPSERDVTLKLYIQTNPYGGKSFDTGKYMWSLKIIDTLREEAWKFLGEGKYPPKPDFKALEEEGKKEYLKTHKEKR